jgi:hypothetical protein
MASASEELDDDTALDAVLASVNLDALASLGSSNPPALPAAADAPDRRKRKTVGLDGREHPINARLNFCFFPAIFLLSAAIVILVVIVFDDNAILLCSGDMSRVRELTAVPCQGGSRVRVRALPVVLRGAAIELPRPAAAEPEL